MVHMALHVFMLKVLRDLLFHFYQGAIGFSKSVCRGSGKI